MRMIRVFALATVLSGPLLFVDRGFAWHDLAPDLLRKQIARIADPKPAPEDRRARPWVW